MLLHYARPSLRAASSWSAFPSTLLNPASAAAWASGQLVGERPAGAAAACDALLRRHLRTPFETAVIEGHYSVALRAPFAGAPPLVLAPGFAAGAAFYLPVLDALARTHHVHAVDWRGTGASLRPRFPASASATVASAEAWFVDALDKWRSAAGLDAPVVLAGHSLGGYLAAAYALAHPARVGHLVLLSPAGLGPAPRAFLDPRTSHWALRALAQAWDAGVTPQGLMRSLGPLGRAWTGSLARSRFGRIARDSRIEEGLFVAYFSAITEAPGSGEHALSVLLSPGGYGRAAMAPRLLRAAAEAREGGCFPPRVSIMYGQHDWIPAGPGSALVSELRAHGVDAAFSTVPSAGHLLFLDAPRAFVRTLSPRLATP